MKKKTVSIVALAMSSGMLHAAENMQGPCSGNQVKLHLDTNRIHVTPPEPKCVSVPGEFTIRVASGGSTVDPGVGDVVVHEKPSSGLQIRGENDPDPDEVVVKVTGTAAGSDDHGYFIDIDGHGKLDPEVRIVTRLMALRAQVQAAEGLLEEELGLSLEEFEEVLREFRELQMK